MSEANFATWFRERLKAKGQSAGEFAQAARISRAAAYFYLDGSRVPNSAALDKLSIALGIERSSMPAFAPRSSK